MHSSSGIVATARPFAIIVETLSPYKALGHTLMTGSNSCSTPLVQLTRQHQSGTLPPIHRGCVYIGGDIEKARGYATRAEDALLHGDGDKASHFMNSAKVFAQEVRGEPQSIGRETASLMPSLGSFLNVSPQIADAITFLTNDELRSAATCAESIFDSPSGLDTAANPGRRECNGLSTSATRPLSPLEALGRNGKFTLNWPGRSNDR